MRVSLNAWPQAPRDNYQFAYLVLGSRDRGINSKEPIPGSTRGWTSERGLNPTHNLDGQKSNRVMPTSECQAFSLSSGPFGRLGKITLS